MYLVKHSLLAWEAMTGHQSESKALVFTGALFSKPNNDIRQDDHFNCKSESFLNTQITFKVYNVKVVFKFIKLRHSLTRRGFFVYFFKHATGFNPAH